MINKKLIYRIIGMLLYIEAALLLLCTFFPIYYGEDDLIAFLSSVALTTLAGSGLVYLGKGAERQAGRKDGYVIVSFSWVILTLFGMLPFFLSGYIPNLTDAFFETMSGFTTTGATILNNIESLPHGLLFWRSMTQWIGGLGIIFFTIAVLPIFGAGGIQLFAAEATGPTHSKLHPRIGVSAKWIWSIYFGLTLAESLMLSYGGMDWFDSICHSMTTTATGGYSTKQNSIAAYQSPFIEYIIILFMFLSGINFSLLFFSLLKGKIQKLFKDTEFRWYLGSILIFTLFTVTVLFITKEGDWQDTFRKALFQVISIQTTTGYVSSDYMSWSPVLWLLMTILMYIGASAGSTSGSIKCVRIAILAQIAHNQFKRILHPNAVLPVRINQNVVPTTTQATLLAFIVVYVVAIFVGWLLVTLTGVAFMESYGIVVASISNVGCGLGIYGPIYSWETLPDVTKWICCALMLIGRLELFSVLLLFTRGFWKKQ